MAAFGDQMLEQRLEVFGKIAEDGFVKRILLFHISLFGRGVVLVVGGIVKVVDVVVFGRGNLGTFLSIDDDIVVGATPGTVWAVAVAFIVVG